MGDGQLRLLDQVRDRIRRKHHSIRTSRRRGLDPPLRVASQQETPPRHGGGGGRGVPDPPRGREGGVRLDAEPGQDCGPSLYKEVLGEPLPWLEGIESAKRPAPLPVVLTREEVKSIPAHPIRALAAGVAGHDDGDQHGERGAEHRVGDPGFGGRGVGEAVPAGKTPAHRLGQHAQLTDPPIRSRPDRTRPASPDRCPDQHHFRRHQPVLPGLAHLRHEQVPE